MTSAPNNPDGIGEPEPMEVEAPRRAASARFDVAGRGDEGMRDALDPATQSLGEALKLSYRLLQVGIVALVIVSLAPAVERLAVLYGGGFVLTGATILEALALVGAGTLLGWLGAWLGAARLIARIEPRD